MDTRQVIEKIVCLGCGKEYSADTKESHCAVDGSFLAPIFVDPLIGNTFADRFSVFEVLGSGSFGKVYRAQQIPLGRPIALKVLHGHFENDLEKIRRFEREARAISQLHHPNILEIYDFGMKPEPFIAMEYIEGITLEQYLKKKQPSFETTLCIAEQVLDALQHADSKGILHRDLTPNNILLVGDPDGKPTVKIVDFGLAKCILGDGNESHVTRTGETVGTPAFMSPEQCRGEELDGRSDIYSFGIILFRMFTGRLPYSGHSIFEWMHKHTLESLPPMFPDGNGPVTVLAIEPVIQQMLAKDPKERYPNAGVAKSALRDATTGGVRLPALSPRALPSSLIQIGITTACLLTCFCFAAYFLNTVHKAPKESAIPYQRKAMEAINNWKWQEARDYARQALEADRSVDSYITAGYANSVNSNSDVCLAAYNKAIEMAPRCARAYALRAQMYIDLSRWNEAMADIEKARSLDPSCAGAFRAMALFCLYKNDPNQALINANNAVRLDPTDPYSYYVRAWAEIDVRRTDEAVADCSKAISMAPNPRFFAMRGWAYDEAGKWQMALADSDYATTHDASDGNAYNCKAWALNELGRYQEAVAAATKGIAAEPENAGLYGTRATAWEKLGNTASAESDRATEKKLTLSQL